jgi:competence protein ComEA
MREGAFAMFEQPHGDSEVARPPSLSSLLKRAGLGGVPRGAVAGCVVLVVVALGFVGWRLGGAAAGGEFAYEPSGEEAGEEASPGSAATESGPAVSEPSVLWVHVAGAVRTPGLYELPSGSRVGDAITVAGGTLEGASLNAVNLARLLDDGEQVYVPSEAEVEAGALPPAAQSQGDTGASQASGSAAGVDINTAGATELEALPGVGPATATKIIADREANGPFASPEDIMRVPGIGEKKFESMRELIVVK